MKNVIIKHYMQQFNLFLASEYEKQIQISFFLFQSSGNQET
jgi:hypothetical protein